MLVAILMGFASGLPLLLTGSVLQAWLKDGGVDLASIGLFALVGLPYTLKFLWSPLFDRYIPPLFGRRRGWILVMQAGLAAALFFLSMARPAAGDLLWVSVAALLVAFFPHPRISSSMLTGARAWPTTNSDWDRHCT